MRVEIQPNYLFVDIPYAYNYVAKQVGAIEFNRSRKMWKFATNIYVMRELMKHLPPLRVHEEFVAYGKQLRAQMDALLSIKAMNDTVGDPRLRPYQRVDVAYLMNLKAAGVFNEPRTGKTPTILTVIKRLETKRNLVVVPASLLLNWKQEIETWYPEAEVFVVQGTPKQRLAIYDNYVKASKVIPSVMIVSKDTLKGKDSSIFSSIHFDVAIVDEAHFLRNRNTAQSKAVHALKAERKYALTGTPTVKSGVDLYGILSWLYPDQYSSYWTWVERYFNVYETGWTGGIEIGDYNPLRKKELQEIVGFMSVQRKRKDKGVMDWLPDKTRIAIPVQMETKQRKAYKEMEDTFVTQDEEGNMIDAASVLAQLMRLRQLCIDPKLVGIDAPSAKNKALMEYLEDNPQPVVIMSMFTSYLKMLHKQLTDKGYRVGMIHGELSANEKHQAKEDFQSGKTDVLLCNTISAGVGFTFDRADTAIFLDKAWNPADQDQAEDRIVPTDVSRLHSINIVTFPIVDSVDERIDKILETKTNLTEVINTGARDAILKLIGKG